MDNGNKTYKPNINRYAYTAYGISIWNSIPGSITGIEFRW